MILKELDPFVALDKYSAAGRKAEEQMAFFLRRFFGNSADVDVLNGLRIELDGEVAQMDHLVLHPHGLLIVESKSVAGSVQIKDDGQWIRWYAKQPSGMRSPVTQARMQSMLLKALLEKAVRQKGFFDTVRFDVLVAISDTGTIQWPASGALPEVCKADQVPDRVIWQLEQVRRGQLPDVLTDQHRQVVAEFLRKAHKPFDRTMAMVAEAVAPARMEQPAAVAQHSPGSPAPETPPSKAQLPTKACKHCGAEGLELLYGKFGYYFQCQDCGKNTNIKFDCPACSGEGRIRKDNHKFFAECRVCTASVLYHSNPR